MGGGRNGSERRTWKEEELGEVEERVRTRVRRD